MHASEIFYPLHAYVCDKCWLVQLDSNSGFTDHFHSDYVYFSSYSDSWLEHSRSYVDHMIDYLNLNSKSKVMEIASNDGYLLQYFVQAGIPCIGIEPTANTAAAARDKGVNTMELFFGIDTAKHLSSIGWQVDLLLGNNVLAHVPDINDFIGGMPFVLKPDGVVTLEFPHLLQLILENQFDTIYHEHYSYLSLTALLPIFERTKLRIFHVEKITTHGGSLRIFVCHKNSLHKSTSNVSKVIKEEIKNGLSNKATYTNFDKKISLTKRSLLRFILEEKEKGMNFAAYGAAAKGNTLLNYCGIGADLIDFVADKNPIKQGQFLPGSQIPVVSPDMIIELKPDYLLILPWNIKREVIHQMSGIRKWGGKFITAIPTIEITP